MKMVFRVPPGLVLMAARSRSEEGDVAEAAAG